jgi:hypothetical protein
MSDGADVTTVDEFERARRARRVGLSDFRDEDGGQIEALEFARRKCKLPDLVRVVKHGEGRAALYDLELDGGERIPIGKSGDVLNPRKVDEAVASVEPPVVIPWWGREKWRPIAAALLAIAEVEEGSTEDEETAGWLASFCRGELSATEIDTERAEDLVRILEGGEPRGSFRSADDRLYVRLEPLMRHVLMHIGTRPTRPELSARLARLGFDKEQLAARDGERVHKARYWRSPPGFDAEEAG